MTVSVCIPAFDAERWIGGAIESALAQTEPVLEVVVVDDGSRDGTAAAVEAFREPRVRLHRHGENRGQGAALNTAVRLARGELVKFLAADDLLRPDCVARLAALFRDARVGLAFARRELRGTAPLGWRERYGSVHESFGALAPLNDGARLFARWLEAELRDNWVGEPSSVIVSRALLERTGLFNEHVAGALDLGLWARALPLASVGFVDDELSVFRLHGGSVTARVHGRPRASLDRAWLLHDLATHPELGRRYPRLVALRAQAERRAVKDGVRARRPLPSAGAYLRARARGRPGFARL